MAGQIQTERVTGKAGRTAPISTGCLHLPYTAALCRNEAQETARYFPTWRKMLKPFYVGQQTREGLKFVSREAATEGRRSEAYGDFRHPRQYQLPSAFFPGHVP